MTDPKPYRIPFSDDEKGYIRRHAYKRSWGHIASQLNVLFLEHNGGGRSGRVVKQFSMNETNGRDRSASCLPVPIRCNVIDMLHAMGFGSAEISDILLTRLNEMVEQAQK